ncbi:MAG: EAL domain-containing protein, partial [Spirochaetaceae bacterium]|nr:EAL domain-containing protein [Spirochaetaceae bacterium]
PLRRRDEEPYGVLGVEISLDYLHSMLPYSELNRERNGTYLVGLTSPDKPEYDIIISSKSPYSSRAMPGSGGVVLFENEPYMGSIYPTTSRAGVYGCMQYFDLYDVNTPFEMEQWVLLGLIDRSDLFSASINVMNSVFISLVVSLLIGIIGVGIAAVAFTRPIVGLAARVRRSDPDGPIKLPRCNINEVDELTAAVEALSRDVATSASRMSQVISLLNMPITVFMYQQGSDRVYCSDSFFDVTGSEIPGEQGLYISKEIFERRMAAVTTDPDAEDADLYRIVDDLGEQHWIRIRIKREMVGSMEKTLGIITDVTEETLEKRKIEHDRDYDGLTKLLNRHAFRALVTKKLAENPEGVGAFIMWDLDNLKYINDSYGHDMGDIYISTMADFIRHLSMDRGIVARMSGDEFFAFLYEYDSKDEIRRIIEQIQEKMQNTWLTLPDGKNVKVRASAGIAWYPDNAQTYEELARFSDFAMYEIKNTLKGTYFEFDERNYHRDSFLLTCKGELDKIIDEELLKYAFQPIVDARTGAIYAYEALMRSQSENLSSPQDIIRLARSQAKLYQIERLTWFKALECYAAHEELFGDTLLFINSVPSYVLNDQDLDEFETKYRPFLDRIVIELLEGDQSDEDCTLKKKELIALWRGKIAIDDFGSGYNNELILLMVRPDFVKIDMSIITSIDLDTKKQYIVQNLISYARNMGIKILAEGVETRGEMEMLISLGVDYMQGYYLGKPLFEPSQLSPEIQEQILTTAALYAPQSAVEA